MEELAQNLSWRLSRPVVDKSGLNGRYDFKLEWTSDSAVPPVSGNDAAPAAADPPWRFALRRDPGATRTEVGGAERTG